jgi:hypothetical protein
MPSLKFLKLLAEIRGHLSTHFPFGSSTIAEDIIFKVLNAYFSETELSVKVLFADLPYSLMGTRHHFNRLLKDDWIECIKSDKDARVRLVVPTIRLLKEITFLSENFLKIFDEYLIATNLEKVHGGTF